MIIDRLNLLALAGLLMMKENRGKSLLIFKDNKNQHRLQLIVNFYVHCCL